jgi:hypothetical protein
MLTDLGMIDLARGEFERGLDRLMLAEENMNHFYVGLAHLKMGNEQGAIRELVKTISGYFWGSALDEYGFLETAIANRILIAKDDYGESREILEEKWEERVHDIPFDAPVAGALAKLYERRLERLDKDKDAAVYQRLERKLKLVRSRAARYNIASFSSQGM